MGSQDMERYEEELSLKAFIVLSRALQSIKSVWKKTLNV